MTTPRRPDGRSRAAILIAMLCVLAVPVFGLVRQYLALKESDSPADQDAAAYLVGIVTVISLIVLGAIGLTLIPTAITTPAVRREHPRSPVHRVAIDRKAWEQIRALPAEKFVPGSSIGIGNLVVGADGLRLYGGFLTPQLIFMLPWADIAKVDEVVPTDSMYTRNQLRLIIRLGTKEILIDFVLASRRRFGFGQPSHDEITAFVATANELRVAAHTL